MKKQVFSLVFSILALSICAFGQTSWLDRPLTTNWNNGSGVVPNAPQTFAPLEARCKGQIRNPESIADRAVTRAGWSLFGASQTYGAVTVVNGLAGFDGMCRPTQFNTFVFVSNRFAGTLSPDVMNAREDGSLTNASLYGPTSITAEFNRYTSNDPLCCPSQKSSVSYSLTTGASARVKADNVDTGAVCGNDSGGVTTQDNIISGTVTYRQRIALPPTAVLTVRLEDVSRADASATVVSEQRIETAGKQIPIPFDLVFDWKKIQERNRYSVRAEITDGGRLLYISDTASPVLTQGNPRNVDITVVPVRGGGGQGGQRDRTLRGTVTYLQRSALPNNSVVTVRLVDLSGQAGSSIAETTVNTNGRQVPIPFELNYANSNVNFQGSYGLEAEIATNGVMSFKTERPEPVQLRGTQAGNIELRVVPAGPTAITGQTLSLSKFGTGSLKIGTRGTQFLIRGNVTVNTNGDAEVTVAALEGSTTFTGKLTYFDATTLRIAVQSSGDADASGEIEVKYSGRKLNSIAGTNLVLDGQDVTLRF
jgi:uncharacterized lipoprotein YbaY